MAVLHLLCCFNRNVVGDQVSEGFISSSVALKHQQHGGCPKIWMGCSYLSSDCIKSSYFGVLNLFVRPIKKRTKSFTIIFVSQVFIHILWLCAEQKQAGQFLPQWHPSSSWWWASVNHSGFYGTSFCTQVQIKINNLCYKVDLSPSWEQTQDYEVTRIWVKCIIFFCQYKNWSRLVH